MEVSQQNAECGASLVTCSKMKQFLKELIIESAKVYTQRHFKRSELWFVSKGECVVKHGRDTEKSEEYDTINLKTLMNKYI